VQLDFQLSFTEKKRVTPTSGNGFVKNIQFVAHILLNFATYNYSPASFPTSRPSPDVADFTDRGHDRPERVELAVRQKVPVVIWDRWDDFSEAFPAFLTLVATPLTFSIATGLSLGMLSFTFIKVGSTDIQLALRNEGYRMTVLPVKIS
jgi:hypothetical protein